MSNRSLVSSRFGLVLATCLAASAAACGSELSGEPPDVEADVNLAPSNPGRRTNTHTQDGVVLTYPGTELKMRVQPGESFKFEMRCPASNMYSGVFYDSRYKLTYVGPGETPQSDDNINATTKFIDIPHQRLNASLPGATIQEDSTPRQWGSLHQTYVKASLLQTGRYHVVPQCIETSYGVARETHIGATLEVVVGPRLGHSIGNWGKKLVVATVMSPFDHGAYQTSSTVHFSGECTGRHSLKSHWFIVGEDGQVSTHPSGYYSFNPGHYTARFFCYSTHTPSRGLSEPVSFTVRGDGMAPASSLLSPPPYYRPSTANDSDK